MKLRLLLARGCVDHRSLTIYGRVDDGLSKSGAGSIAMYGKFLLVDAASSSGARSGR
jgi:hypothetical protein